MEDLKHDILTIKERNRLTVNGVVNIEGFDEGCVALEISGGKLTVEGRGLKIESLCKENGEMQITGRIDGLFYTEKNKLKSGWFKIFG